MSSARYPTPNEIRAAIHAAVSSRISTGRMDSLVASPLVAYLRPRYTWDGEGFDVVADAVVVWQRSERSDGWGLHASATIRSSSTHGVYAALAGGRYDLTAREASLKAQQMAGGWAWMGMRAGE